MKDNQGTTSSSQRASGPSGSVIGGAPRGAPGRGVSSVAARAAILRVVIRPARPDDLEHDLRRWRHCHAQVALSPA